MMQQKSKTFRYGEPEDHEQAVQKVRWFLESKKKDLTWQIDDNLELKYYNSFIRQLPKNRIYNGHNADLAIVKKIVNMDYGLADNIPEYKPIALIEIGGDIGFWYMSAFTNRPKKAKATKHSKPLQKRNDKIVQNYCENEDIKYITLLKEEILGDCKKDKEYWMTGLRYLQEHPDLQEFIISK